MFQRIQSVYLILALIIISINYFMPFAEIILDSSQVYKLSVFNISSVSSGEIIFSTIPLLILLIIIQLLVLSGLILFKKRKLQIRILTFAIILDFGFYGLLSFYFIKLMNNFEMKSHFSFSLIFPLIALFLMFFAIRAISKDEKLVKSMDRLR